MCYISQSCYLVGDQLVRDLYTSAPYDELENIGHAVCMAVRKYGIILRPVADTVVIMPPLSVTISNWKSTSGFRFGTSSPR